MRNKAYFSLCACVLFLITSNVYQLQGATKTANDLFPSQCQPFNAPPQHHPIDTNCGLSGEPSTEESRKQDMAKNNLCASDAPVLVTVGTFDDLQQAAQNKGISFGNQHIPHPKPLPSDRSLLKNLAKNTDGVDVGEGTNVRFVAFVLRPSEAVAKA